jgi:integrase
MRRTGAGNRGRKTRIYWRNQGGVQRAYADLRDLGGGQVALIAKGEKRATTDPVIAEELLRQRLNDLTEKRRNRVLLGIDPEADLESYVDRHLQLKAESGEQSKKWLALSKMYLDRAVDFFTKYQHASEPEPKPRPRNLAAISAQDVHAYTRWLKDQPNGRGGTNGKQTIRHHLHVLSNVFKRAISEGKLPMGHNPVAAMMDKPTVPLSTTRLLEVDELTLLLESARTLPRGGAGGRERLLCAYELVATFVLTGLRENEARHLDVRDVDFGAACIDVRGTKTRGSIRTIPLHPQLAEILHPYVQRLHRRSGPLFTGRTGGPFGTWTGTLDAISARVGYAPGEVRTRRFRVSYATHRSTCDGVDSNTVRLELGHGSLAMMERVYARAQRRSRRMGAEMAFRVDNLGP